MIVASAVYLFIAVAVISGFADKKEKRDQEHKEVMKQVEELQMNEKEAKELRTDDGRKINIEIYKKYNVKYPTFEPTNNKESKDKAVMERFEEMAKKNNMSVPEYITKEKDIVAANVQKEKEKQMKKADEAKAKNASNNAASSTDSSQSKKYIKDILNQLNDNISTWKAMNGGKLNQNDVKVINSDLNFVLEHVHDLEEESGTTEQIEQFKRAVNAHINAFQIGEVKDVSKLISQANNE